MPTESARETVDGRGKRITTFVVYEAKRRIEAMRDGDRLEVLTDDFEPFHADLEAWCRSTGHRLLESGSADSGLRFVIEKRSRASVRKTLAMVVSVVGLEELLSPLGFALAAALEDIEVDLFFQGPAVRVLARGFRPRLRGWSRPFSRFAVAQMSKAGHLPPRDKLEQLRSLGARIYVCGPSMEHFKVAASELMFEDLRVVEYLSFMRVMAKAEIQLWV